VCFSLPGHPACLATRRWIPWTCRPVAPVAPVSPAGPIIPCEPGNPALPVPPEHTIYLCQMSKTCVNSHHMSRVWTEGVGSRRNVRRWHMQLATKNCSVFRCAMKVVMVAKLFVTGKSSRQLHYVLNALDWKLILVVGWQSSGWLENLKVKPVNDNQASHVDKAEVLLLIFTVLYHNGRFNYSSQN